MVDNTLHDEFFFPSLHEIQTRLVLHDHAKKTKSTQKINKNFPDCLMKKFKKKKVLHYTKLSNITRSSYTVSHD